MTIKFTKDTPVNKGIFKKGDIAKFTNDIAQKFIDNKEAEEVKAINKKRVKDDSKSVAI